MVFSSAVEEIKESDRSTSDPLKGLVFDIQRYSLHDGPGIRTLVFLKGCPLACRWCSNPESQAPRRELMIMPSKCIGCGQCVAVCTSGAAEKQIVREARTLCTTCGQCVTVCPASARRMVGEYMSVDEVMLEIEKDLPFYRRSGGGMTATGGEPLQQADFLAVLFKTCRERGIHTAVETCGYGKWHAFEKILKHVELVLYDIKHMDPARHKELTGMSNELILQNAKKIAALGKEMIIRMPVVPACNDTNDNMLALAEFAQELSSVKEVHLLPYHRLGQSKYDRLGMTYLLADAEAMDRESLIEQAKLLESYKLHVRIGG